MRDEIYFDSEPRGAEILVKGKQKGVTPKTLKIKRRIVPPKIEMKLDGHVVQSVDLENQFNPVSIANMLCPLCWAVDIGTQAVKKYGRRSYLVALEPISSKPEIDVKQKARKTPERQLLFSDFAAAWSKIKIEMEMQEVQSLLGMPTEVIDQGDGKKSWVFGEPTEIMYGQINFNKDSKVSSWRKPEILY